jgi:hypothetical protein
VAVVAPHPWLARLTRIGFRRRGEAPVVVHALPGTPLDAAVLQHSTWFLTQGDRDG